MPAEGKPHAESSLLGKPLVALTRLVTRFPISTMVISVLVAAVSIFLAQSRLKFHTNRDDLLNPKSQYHHRWLEYTQEFGAQEDVIVVVTGENRQAIVPVLEEVAGLLNRESKLFRSIFYKVDRSKLVAKGLYRRDTQELQQIEGFLDQAKPVCEGNWAALNVGGCLAWMSSQLAQGDPSQLQQMLGAARPEQAQALHTLSKALGQAGPYQSPWPVLANTAELQNKTGPEYLLSNGDRVGMVMLWLTKDESGNFAQYAESIRELRHIIAGVKARHPTVWLGLTGLPVMENDEMESSETAMTQAGVLSFIGVALLYVAGFGCIRHPLMATIALLTPMAWAFGYIVIVVGHLNILSSAFATIIIGLGSDFGVYHIAQYLRLRGQSLPTREALVQTARSIGPGITTGALSTALAFFTIGLTDFPGVAELGIIAGGGIILCWIAAMTTLPAMIQWSDAPRKPWRIPVPLDVYAWLKPVMARPKLLLAVYFTGTAIVATGIGRLWYDHNLLNLQADGVESVELERKLLSQNSQSTSFALSVAQSREELLARKAAFLSQPMVDRVCDIVEFLEGDPNARSVRPAIPGEEAQKHQIISRISQRLTSLPESVPPIPVVSREDLDKALAQLQQVLAAAPAGEQPAQQAERLQQAEQFQQLRQLVRGLPDQEYYRRLSAFQQSMAADVLERLKTLQMVSNPEPPQLTDLPASLVARFVGKHGYYAMQVYSKADIWDMDAMQKFVGEVRSVDPNATGNPLQVYEASRQMKRSYEQAAWYALFTVLIIVYLDFQSIRMTLLALLPLAVAIVQMFGLMGFLNIPLNAANMIVLPLILGVGVDGGVHVIHDYLREPRPYRMSGSTAAAIVVNTLQNIVGFGSLMIATHRGLHSLGRVLTIGMACALLSALMMPALLQFLPLRRNNEKPDAEPVDHQSDNCETGDCELDAKECDSSAAAEIPLQVEREIPAPQVVPIKRRTEAAA